MFSAGHCYNGSGQTGPVLHLAQVSKPMVEAPLQQSRAAAELNEQWIHSAFAFSWKSDAISCNQRLCFFLPRSLMSQSITDTLWNTWNPLESPWDPCWIPQPFNICNYTKVHKNYCLFFTSSPASSVEGIFAPRGESKFSPIRLCSFLPVTFMTVCSFAGHVYSQSWDLTASRFPCFLL